MMGSFKALVVKGKDRDFAALFVGDRDTRSPQRFANALAASGSPNYFLSLQMVAVFLQPPIPR